MKTQLQTLMFLGLISNHALAIEIIEPQELQTSSIQIGDPDRHIKTLGQVAFKIDLSAAHDDLLALKVRRSSLTLEDGRSFTAFGVHKDAGIIVIAGRDVSHISIASVEDNQGTHDASVLFYGKDNSVISPRTDDVAVFDTDFNPLSFTYTPLQTPGSLQIPVSIALDTSGSMAGHMSTVISETREFLSKLPDFTLCRIVTFSTDVNHLTPVDQGQLTNCPASAYLLNSVPQAEGATALYKAIQTGFNFDTTRINQNFPNITVVVTDGVNTIDYGETLASLQISKANSNSKLFVFWAGSYVQGHLQGLTDLEFVSTNNLSGELDKFFHSLGVSLSGLQTLHIRK